MRFVYLCCTLIILLSCNDQQDTLEDAQQQVKNLTQELEIAKEKLSEEHLIHAVYVWLKDDLSEEDRKKFEASAKSLGDISSIARFRMGKPASTEERDVVDHSYSYAMTIEFKDIEAQNAYQIDPIHLKFVEDCQAMWDKVVVYDHM